MKKRRVQCFLELLKRKRLAFWKKKFSTFFWRPKMGGRGLKTPFLATRRRKMKKRMAHCFLELLKMKRWIRKKNGFWSFWPPYPKNVIFDQKHNFWPPGAKNEKKFQWIHMSILYIKILYDMGFWILTFFWLPKMGGPYLKTPILATRGPKIKKRRALCFLELLKSNGWTRKKNWFLTFLTPPQKRHFLTEKRHFWPPGGQTEKTEGIFICPFHIWRYCMIWVFDLRHFFVPPYDPPSLFLGTLWGLKNFKKNFFSKNEKTPHFVLIFFNFWKIKKIKKISLFFNLFRAYFRFFLALRGASKICKTIFFQKTKKYFILF